MIWDMEALPLSITSINTIILQLEKSEDELIIKNVTRTDLDQVKEALAFYNRIHFEMAEINKSVQASTDLILELVKDKKGIVEVVMDKLEQFKNNQHEKEQPSGLDTKFRRKI